MINLEKVLLLKNKDEEFISPYKCVIIDYPYKPLNKPDWNEFVKHYEQIKQLINKGDYYATKQRN